MRTVLRGGALLAVLIGVVVVAPSAAAQYQYPPGYGGYTDPYAQYYNPYGTYSSPYTTGYPYGTYPYNTSAYPYNNPYNGPNPYSSYPYNTGAYPYNTGAYPYNTGAYPYNTYPYGSAYPYGPSYGYNTSYAGYPPPALGSPFYNPYTPPPGYPGVGGAFQATATLTSPTNATVSWAVYPGATSYAVYVGQNGAPLTMFTTTPATTVSVPVTGANTQFQVHALGPNGFDIAVSNITGVVPNGAYNPYTPYNPFAPGGVGVPAATVAPATIGTQVTVTVLDVNGNPVPNVQVAMTPGRAGDSATPVYVNPMTGPNGQVIFQVRGGAPGVATFNTTANGIQLAAVTITFQ